ncbi:hypothetical protein SNK04_007755 [Fusarium graminearum]
MSLPLEAPNLQSASVNDGGLFRSLSSRNGLRQLRYRIRNKQEKYLSAISGSPRLSLSSSSSDSVNLADADAESFSGLRELPIVFAVDVSGSTKGKILKHEQETISKMTSMLDSSSLRAQSTILPWDGRAHAQLPCTKFKSLKSGAGTNPTVLLDDAANKVALQNSKLWFLMTDGAIEERLVHRFANAIPQTGLHGTASVIILFGYPHRSPFDCNVSVGMSVFAVAPHCVFLFHDVQTSRVYVFQAKGSFTALLWEESSFTPFGPATRWQNLTRITYDDLSRIKIPKAERLGEDTVVLPNGKRLNMANIYNNTLSREETLRLLSDYSALDVILLAARTRGKDSSVRSWIESARDSYKIPDIAFLERQDVDGRAKATMGRLLAAISKGSNTAHKPVDIWHYLLNPTAFKYNLDSSATAKIEAFQSTLRLAHKRNWRRFSTCGVGMDQESSNQINEAVDEVLSTMNSYISASTMSPAILTPMSSPAPGNGYLSISPVESLPLAPPDLTQPPYRRRQSPLAPRTKKQQTTSDSPLVKDLLYVPGFRAERTPSRSSSSPVNLYGPCLICQEPEVIQVLLLQHSSPENSTPGLPGPGQRVGHKYPLLLGNFPETDTVLPITSCDACASSLVESGQLPNGDTVAAALPLVSLTVSINRKLWEKKLAELYGHRFHENIVLLLFLSTLCVTIEYLIESKDPSDSPALTESLEWCCKEICKIPGLGLRAGLTPAGSLLAKAVSEQTSLEQTLCQVFCGMRPVLREGTLLSYPMEGFLVLIRLAGLVDSILPKTIEQFVWKGLLYQFTQQHAKLQGESGVEEASCVLKALLPGQANTISLSDLKGTYLLPDSPSVLEDFQRTGSYFAAVDTDTYNVANAVFLYLLLVSSTDTLIKDVANFFTLLQYDADELNRLQGGSCNVFEDCRIITKEIADKLIAAIYK